MRRNNSRCGRNSKCGILLLWAQLLSLSANMYVVLGTHTQLVVVGVGVGVVGVGVVGYVHTARLCSQGQAQCLIEDSQSAF